MSQNTYIALVLFFMSQVGWAQQHPLRCGNELFQYDEAAQERMLELERFTQQWIADNRGQATAREIFNIPVVVHVVYKNEEERLSVDQVATQIAALNIDFNGLTENENRIPGEFRSLKANVGFQFCLAAVDPDGAPTTGIEYYLTTVDCIANTFDTKNNDNRPSLFYTDSGGADVWDRDRYLNIWVGDACNRYLGRTQLPGAALAAEDGVVVDYRYFGNGCNPYAVPFHLGRTTTHEVGHFFNLRHIFSSPGCNDDDLVSDTPQQEESYDDCPSYPQHSCNSSDMFMNFMDYVDDECMLLFTEEQKLRMLAALNSPIRVGLLESDVCMLPPDGPTPDGDLVCYPNPAQHCIYLSWQKSYEGPLEVRLFSAEGKLLYERDGHSAFIHPILVEKLLPGIYFLSVIFGDDHLTRKVMIR